MGFDLTHAPDVATREDEGLDVLVRDQNGEPYTDPAFQVRVAGEYSTRYREARNRQRKRIYRAARGGDMDHLADEVIDTELAAACVISWEGLQADGQPVPCTRENARRVFEAAPWIFEQIRAAMGNHARFFSNGSAS